MGPSNQVGIGLSYRPASLCSLATQFHTQFLELFLTLLTEFLYEEIQTLYSRNNFDCVPWGKVNHASKNTQSTHFLDKSVPFDNDNKSTIICKSWVHSRSKSMDLCVVLIQKGQKIKRRKRIFFIMTIQRKPNRYYSRKGLKSYSTERQIRKLYHIVTEQIREWVCTIILGKSFRQIICIYRQL